MEFASLKGFKDILPEETAAWHKLERSAREVFRCFGFREIRPPLMERTELFNRSIGQETDIVSKEMYTLLDSRGRGMTLRPEATASVVRAYVQHRLYLRQDVQKLYTIGPMFRHERPQKGRLRQFHQINAEILGDPGPRSDAELILMAMMFLERIALTGVTLNLNSLGCPGCRSGFKQTLGEYLQKCLGVLCPDCRRRAETNPLRVFDCKVPACGEVMEAAPRVLDFICPDCRAHFEAVQEHLQEEHVDFILNPRLVRGLDYYNRTTFEIQTDQLGAQNAVVGGGRYDGLVELIGGPDLPAIGFAMGMERLVALLDAGEPAVEQGPDLFIAALGEAARSRALHWALRLRRAGVAVDMEYGDKGLKSQMKRADRLKARRVLIVGEDELQAGQAILRDMQHKRQEVVGLNDLIPRIQGILEKR